MSKQKIITYIFRVTFFTYERNSFYYNYYYNYNNYKIK